MTTIKELNVLLDALNYVIQKNEASIGYDKRQLADLQKVFEDGTATEQDRKDAEYYERSIGKAVYEKETLEYYVHIIETKEFTVAL